MGKKRVVILGGGISGVAMASFYGDGAEVYEQDSELGGKCRTFRVPTSVGTFVFDVGGHWLHLNGFREMGSLFQGLADYRRRACVSTRHGMVDFPIQQHYDQLNSPSRVARISRELAEIAERYDAGKTFDNYRDMLIGSYGASLYSLFFGSYNEKLFGMVDLSEISYGKFELIRNVRIDNKVGYNDVFKYPSGDVGIYELIRQLKDMAESKGATFHTGKRAVEICPEERTVTFSDCSVVEYDVLVNTTPLRSFCTMINNLPDDVRRNAAGLKASRGRIYNLGIVAPMNEYADKTWVYYADYNLPFYRVGVYSNVEKQMAPEGYSSIYVECDTFRPIGIKDVVNGLLEEGWIQRQDDVVVSQKIDLAENYCFTDSSVDSIISHLEGLNIHSIGRYGRWEWTSMHENVSQAVFLADTLKGGM